MKAKRELEQLIVRYLLGQTTSAEDDFIEERYASEPDFLNLVEVVEDDLVDAYIQRKLSPAENEDFEHFFLASTDNRDKVEFARALLKEIHTDEARRTPHPGIQSLPFIEFIRAPLLRPVWSTVAGVAFAGTLLATVFGWWLLTNGVDGNMNRLDQSAPANQSSSETRKQNGPSADDATAANADEQQTSNRTQNSRHKSITHRQRRDVPSVVTFILSPGLTRGPGELTTIEVPKNADLVKLRLSVEIDISFRRYSASLQRIGEGVIWTNFIKIRQKERARKSVPKSLSVSLPASVIRGGEYLLTITGRTETNETYVVGDYSFSVVEKR